MRSLLKSEDPNLGSIEPQPYSLRLWSIRKRKRRRLLHLSFQSPAFRAVEHQDSSVPGSASLSAGPVHTWGWLLPLFSSEGTTLSGKPAQSLSQTGSSQVLGFPCFAIGTILSSTRRLPWEILSTPISLDFKAFINQCYSAQICFLLSL